MAIGHFISCCMSTDALQELVENFALFDDWEERYRYLIDLGRGLPEMEEALKTDASLVPGCTSRVWLVAQWTPEGRLSFKADSDAHIVRGLIGVLFKAYQGKTAEEVSATDIKSAFEEVGLDKHLSPNRRNGFFSMVEKIQELAEKKG